MNLDKVKTYLLLGSNLGDRHGYLERAEKLIAAQVGEIVNRSSVYETAAWGNTDQPGFLNLALEVDTRLNPKALLEQVLAIEKDLGRVRHEKWGARLIDIDIILYGNEVVDEVSLQIPHPEMQNRKFVMIPMAEIAPDVIHPVLKKELKEILLVTEDELDVFRKQDC